jgi:hypothetical protein
MGIGPHSGYLLRLFGAHVDRAFGQVPFHVGSSLTEKRGWRDVDVRLILDDDEFEPYADAGRRRMHELAWTAFGSQMTGLPIDFQIQQQTAANDEFSGVRSALLLHECELPIVRRET